MSVTIAVMIGDHFQSSAIESPALKLHFLYEGKFVD